MGRMLEAGVDVRKALKTSSSHTADPRLAVILNDVSRCVKQGDDLTTAFSRHEDRLPTLFLNLLNVGEQTGSLPEIFSSLADYYEANVKRMVEFRSQIAWPVIQLFAAIFIIGGLIYLLGILGQANAGGEAEDILGLGLVGTSGSIAWFMLTLGPITATWIGYKVMTRNLAGQKALDPFLMAIPAIGHCMTSFAIARFSWCFALTQQAGMSIKPSLEASMNATSNGAFMIATPGIWQMLSEGDTLADSLKASRLFPTEYIHVVETAEHTGIVPEALDRMSHRFDEDAHRAMTRLTVILARVIWGLVACFIGFIVISFFMRYVALINSFS